MLVTQELPDLPEVRPAAEELRGKDAAEGMRRHAFALSHARSPRVAEKRLGQNRL